MRKQLVAAGGLCLLAISCGRDEPTAPVVPEPTTGTLEVIVLTSGGDLDDDGYGVYLDTTLHVVPANSGSAPGRIDLVIPAVPVGTHTVMLDRIASNCVLDGANPLPLEVTAGQKTAVTLTVGCLATGTEVSAHTTGFDNPPSYNLIVDGQFAGAVGANDSSAITRLLPGSHVVTLGVRGDNCDVANGRQVTVTVANRSIVPASFDVSCAHAVRREKIAYALDTIVDGINARWIVLINADGSGAMPVVNGDHPTWSPDGTKLAYTNISCEYFAEYYAEPCGGGIEVIDPERWTSIAMPTGSSGLSPAWAPVGETIAFTMCCTTEDRSRVHLASADGSTSDTSVVFPSLKVGEPSWSPDGQHLVVTCIDDDGLRPDLCIARRDSAGLRRLGVGNSISPAWSPDGQRIAFVGPQVEVALVDVNTHYVTPLTHGSAPAWSPDGTRLVVVDGDGLYVINADGTNRTRITHGGQHAPAWRR